MSGRPKISFQLEDIPKMQICMIQNIKTKPLITYIHVQMVIEIHMRVQRDIIKPLSKLLQIVKWYLWLTKMPPCLNTKLPPKVLFYLGASNSKLQSLYDWVVKSYAFNLFGCNIISRKLFQTWCGFEKIKFSSHELQCYGCMIYDWFVQFPMHSKAQCLQPWTTPCLLNEGTKTRMEPWASVGRCDFTLKHITKETTKCLKVEL